MVVVPALLPVTVAVVGVAGNTLAIAGATLLHAPPPIAFAIVIVPRRHTSVGPVIGYGARIRYTLFDTLQPVTGFVAVMFTVGPAMRPTATPLV